jgi:hypothetical protein
MPVGDDFFFSLILWHRQASLFQMHILIPYFPKLALASASLWYCSIMPFYPNKAKTVPLHAMKALGREEV